jgi:hypothetical protein
LRLSGVLSHAANGDCTLMRYLRRLARAFAVGSRMKTGQ